MLASSGHGVGRGRPMKALELLAWVLRFGRGTVDELNNALPIIRNIIP